MEVPPGRVERISDGGAETIRAILAELRAMKFNGVLKTSVYRGDTPSQGVLVLRGGDGVLAEHRSKVDVAGPQAIPEILRDATSPRAQVEVRTYDYGHSKISLDHLQRANPEAAVPGIGNPDKVFAQVEALEAAEREAYLQDLQISREREQRLVDREEELYHRKWEMEQEYQRSAIRQKEIDSLRAELQAVKEASGRIMQQLEERRTKGDVEVQSQRTLLAIETEKVRTELESQRRALVERSAKLESLERDLQAREAVLAEKEAVFGAHGGTVEQERRQLNELYASLQTEMEKVSEARMAFDDRLVETERREKDLIVREQAAREWEDRLRGLEASVSAREQALGEREQGIAGALKELEEREARLQSEAQRIEREAAAAAERDASLDDRREELARATKRMERAAAELAAKDRKIAAEEQEVREQQV
ncbi:MAG TPA: hypothetical protein VFA17_00125, partial [Thermoplasmata archaeon]|nr:hypothetical protein [Thermoplasmata archaeon]